MYEVTSLVEDIMKTKGYCWLGILIAIIFAAVFGYNIQHQAEFFCVSLEAFINVIIAVGVTYYLTQRKSDDRKTKEFIFAIVDQIQQYALQPSLYTFTDMPPEQKHLLLNIRHIRSKIDVLKQYAEKYGYRKEIEDLEKNFDSYQSLMDNHYTDIGYLRKSADEIAKWMQNIDSRCDQLRLKLYPPQ